MMNSFLDKGEDKKQDRTLKLSTKKTPTSTVKMGGVTDPNMKKMESD